MSAAMAGSSTAPEGGPGGDATPFALGSRSRCTGPGLGWIAVAKAAAIVFSGLDDPKTTLHFATGCISSR